MENLIFHCWIDDWKLHCGLPKPRWKLTIAMQSPSSCGYFTGMYSELWLVSTLHTTKLTARAKPWKSTSVSHTHYICKQSNIPGQMLILNDCALKYRVGEGQKMCIPQVYFTFWCKIKTVSICITMHLRKQLLCISPPTGYTYIEMYQIAVFIMLIKKQTKKQTQLHFKCAVV